MPEPKKVEVEDFAEFVAQVTKLGNRGWVFRGHSNPEWKFESSLARFYRTHSDNIKGTSHHVREWDSIKKFQKAAHLHLKQLPDKDDRLNWLAVMQHFGAPTRLIDFTFSPLVALFFAAEGSVRWTEWGKKANDHTYRPFQVHALHVDSVRALTKKIRKGKHLDHEAYCIGTGNKQQLEFVGFFEGAWQNQRQIAQQGLFMVPSKIDMDIHRFLHGMKAMNGNGDPWHYYEFPGGRVPYREMIKSLLWANMTHASLYPGLEGLARSQYLRFYEMAKTIS